MYYKTLSEWEYSSLKRDLERSLSSLSDATRNFESLKRDVDSQMRDYKYAEQSLTRAWEDKIKDEVKKAGAKTGYSSYSYSSYDSKIRDSQRVMERCLSKVSDCVSKMADAKRQIDTLQREATNKLATLTSAYEGVVKQLASTTKDLKAESQKSEALSREKATVECEARSKQQQMQSEMDRFKRNAVVAGAAAAAFTADACNKADAAALEIRRLEAERREWEQKTAEMKSYYEDEIASLKTMVNSVSEPAPAGSSTLDDLANELESALHAFESATKAATQAPISKPKASRPKAPRTKASKPHVEVPSEAAGLSEQDMAALASDYAVLWNEIMEDDVIELREVIQIKEWVRAHAMSLPEGHGLLDWCEAVLAHKVVEATDAQALYDRSFMLLKALGAKIG